MAPEAQKPARLLALEARVVGIAAKARFDPVEIGSLLKNVFLVSVERDPIKFLYRLLGSAIIDVPYANMTGLPVTDDSEAVEFILGGAIHCDASGAEI